MQFSSTFDDGADCTGDNESSYGTGMFKKSHIKISQAVSYTHLDVYKRQAKKYDCAFVDNEMPYGRVPQGHPVIVDYFYHEEIRGTENTGKRNR